MDEGGSLCFFCLFVLFWVGFLYFPLRRLFGIWTAYLSKSAASFLLPSPISQPEGHLTVWGAGVKKLPFSFYRDRGTENKVIDQD